MRCNSSQGAGPELCRSYRRRMNDELISGLVESRCGFQASHIGSMAHLRLRVTAKNLQTVNFGEPKILLLLVCQKVDRLGKHALVQVKRGDTHKHVAPAEGQLVSCRVVEEVFGAQFGVIVDRVDDTPPVGHLLLTSVLEKVDIGLQIRVLPHLFVDFVDLVDDLL